MREIDLIIDENESQVVEWKESWQDKYLEWICGYAVIQHPWCPKSFLYQSN